MVIFVVVSLIFCKVRVSEDEAENFSARVTKSEQCAYIKIETLADNTVPTT